MLTSSKEPINICDLGMMFMDSILLGFAQIVEGLPTAVLMDGGKVFFNAQQLVVFGDAIRTRMAPRFDLSGIGRDGQIGDRRVLRLAGTVRDDRLYSPFVLPSRSHRMFR